MYYGKLQRKPHFNENHNWLFGEYFCAFKAELKTTKTSIVVNQYERDKSAQENDGP